MASSSSKLHLVLERVGPRLTDRAELRAAERALSAKLKNRFPENLLSATHCEGWVALLVSRVGEFRSVGVDLEWVRPRPDDRRMKQVARRLFHLREQNFSLKEFYLSWCAREALGKTLGIGMSSHFRALDLSTLVKNPRESAQFFWEGREYCLALYEVALVSSAKFGVLAVCFEWKEDSAVEEVTAELPQECLSVV